eukprot:6095217-Prymnesium_polylepis.1
MVPRGHARVPHARDRGLARVADAVLPSRQGDGSDRALPPHLEPAGLLLGLQPAQGARAQAAPRAARGHRLDARDDAPRHPALARPLPGT